MADVPSRSFSEIAARRDEAVGRRPGHKGSLESRARDEYFEIGVLSFHFVLFPLISLFSGIVFV